MSRRESSGSASARAAAPPDGCCASPAGASPVPVSAGAPGSRPQFSGEIPGTTAGRQEPDRRREPRSGEQQRGPQHEVNPAASTEKQWGSRAAHVTAKAMLTTPAPERVVDSSGVRGAARVEGEVRNTRGPSASPPSRQVVSYKPRAESTDAQRESEASVVPSRVTPKSAAGGKGPWGGHAGGAGKREGMAGTSGPNNPDRRKPIDKVRQLQRQLWVAAKRSPGRRFHALYDRVWRSDVLREAWKRVKR